MNRERAKELLPVYQAFCQGDEIQYRSSSGVSFHDVDDPYFGAAGEWRVKPKQPATNDIKWASHRRQCGRAVRRADWGPGLHWRECGIYSEDGVYVDGLSEDDCLAEDWELYEPESK